jgi:hypothetical protein
MKQLLAIGLITIMCTHAVLAAGPLSRAVEREPSRLAGDVRPPTLPGWEAVMTLEPGALIAVATDEGTLPGELVDADTFDVRVRRGDLVETIAV